MGVVFRNWFFVCFVFRVFWGFCGWVLEALCSPAQMRTQDGPAFRGSLNFGGFVYVLDRFPQRDFGLWVSMCPINIIPFLSLVYISATTPRATTPHLYRTGHHAFTTTAQLSRLCISRLPRRGLPRPILTTTGYHTCVYIPVTTPKLSRSTNTRTSGYHTRYL